jgi:enamine deaminase RidA (YjgF/YER057c/UK114 family)
MRQLISSGSPFERQAGYSRAVSDGDWCWVAGTTGYDYATMSMPDGVAAQAENAIATIAGALGEAGLSLADVVRVTYYIVDAADADAVFAVVGRHFAAIRPAATMVVVAALIRPEMRIEIEVTARRML